MRVEFDRNGEIGRAASGLLKGKEVECADFGDVRSWMRYRVILCLKTIVAFLAGTVSRFRK